MIVVETKEHTTVCVAGPGAGKTRTLVQRVQTAAEFHDPRGFVLITYTNSAADELRDRCAVKVGFIGTLHAFMLKVLREHGDSLGFSPQVQVVSQEQAESMLEDLVQEHRYKGTKKALEQALALGPDVGRRPILKPEEVIAATFFRQLKRDSMVSFDTLLHYGAKLAGQVEGFTHLFVDESQDSSDVDFDIYRALPMAAKFFVGDPDQSIYGFRGGNVTNLVSMCYEAESVLRLEKNYRCDRLIAEAAQRLIEHNVNRVAKVTESVTGGDGFVSFTEHGHPGHEMQVLAAELLGRDDLEECAVLCRTNHEVAKWRDYLPTRGVPVKTRRAVQRPEDWRTTLALLGVLADPSNDMQAFWAASLLYGKTEAMTRKRRALASYVSLSTLIHPAPHGATIDSVVSLLGALVSPASIDLLRSHRDKMPEGATIQDLLLRIAETDTAEADEGQGVTVCTMHAAKGREWMAVWLPGLDQRTTPGEKASVNVEEERRLVYVAMTRAKHELRVSCATTATPRWGHGELKTQPSQFIAEAGICIHP